MNVIALPVLIPILTALALLAVARRPWWRRAISLAAGLALVAVALTLMRRTLAGEILVLAVGSWSPLVGIVWVVDRLSATMLLLASIASLAAVLYAPAALASGRERRRFGPVHQLVLLGVNGSFVTGDLFNLFVFFEVMLVASFVALTLGARAAQLRNAFPYVVINLLGSAMFFSGVGLVYATSGTVNMARLSQLLHQAPLPAAFWAGLGLCLLVFALKAAVVPFYFWLPDSYPHAPLPVAAFFAGLLTKVGVYALFRTMTLFTGPSPGPLHHILLVAAGVTMGAGVIGALGRDSIRSILSFHIISQVGYMVFGLALFTPRGVAAGLFYVVHHIVVKTALFLAGGTVERNAGTGKLGKVTGFAAVHPWVATGFFVPAMALAGIPPLSGFWGKLFLIMAGFERGSWIVTAVAVLVSLLTLASMLKIWFSTFWGTPTGHGILRGVSLRLSGPPLALAALSIAIGLMAPLIWREAERTAHELLDTSRYVTQVLGQTGREPVVAGGGP